MDSLANIPARFLKEALTASSVGFAGVADKDDLVALVMGDRAAVAKTMELFHASKQNGNDKDSEEPTREKGTFHDIDQEGPGWHFIRRGEKGLSLGGSEVWKVLGINNASPLQFMGELVQKALGTWIPEKAENKKAGEDALAHGTLCEPLIAKMYAYYTAFKLEKGGYYSHPDPDLAMLYGASPDGRVLDDDGNVIGLTEFKAPFSRMYTEIKPDHIAQMQYQLAMSGLDWCDYCAVFLNKINPERTIPSKTQVLLVRVYRSEEYLEWMWPRLFLFSKHLMSALTAARQILEAGGSLEKAEKAAALHYPSPLLYSNEANALVKAPMPMLEETRVDIGEWSVREALTGKARTVHIGAVGSSAAAGPPAS